MREGTDVLSLKNQKRGHYDRLISGRKRVHTVEGTKKIKIRKKSKIKQGR
jgi:hypothetical protein